MKCHEARRHVDLFMDGELSVSENMKVLEHLNLCRPCAGTYEGEKALRAGLRGELGAVTAPPELRNRIARALEGAGALRRPTRGRLAAAAFFLALVAAMVLTPAAEPPRLLAAELVPRHEESRRGYGCHKKADRACLCAACTPDEPRELDAFFRRHGRADFCRHELAALGYRFIGVAIGSHRGVLLCWSVQRDAAGHVLSHALLSTPIEAGPPRLVAVGARVVLFAPRGESGMT